MVRCAPIRQINWQRYLRGISSVGRALAWHARGQEFDSPMLHHHDGVVGIGPSLTGHRAVKSGNPSQLHSLHAEFLEIAFCPFLRPVWRARRLA